MHYWLHKHRHVNFFTLDPFRLKVNVTVGYMDYGISNENGATLTTERPSFIHSGYFYSALSNPILLRGAPDYSTDTVSQFHAEVHR